MKRVTATAIGLASLLTVGLAAGPATAAVEHGRPVPVVFIEHGDVYLSTGTVTARITHNGGNSWPRVSPDGTEIAYTHSGDLYVADYFPPNVEITRITHQANAGGSDWSPDGNYLAFLSGDVHTGNLTVIRLHSDDNPAVVAAPAHARRANHTKPLSTAFSPLRTANTVAWSPDGTMIAFPGGDCFGIYDDCLTVLTLATNHEQTVAAFGGGGAELSGFATTPAWSSDSKDLFWTQQQDLPNSNNVGPLQVIGDQLSSGHVFQVGRDGDSTPTFVRSDKFLVTAPHAGTSWITLIKTTGSRVSLYAGSEANWR